jgi:hypothetical protein
MGVRRSGLRGLSSQLETDQPRNRVAFFVCAPAGALCRARRGDGAHSLERRQTPDDHCHDGILGPLGAASFVAADDTGFSDELGGGVAFGGVLCPMGFGAPAPRAGPGHRGGRDPLGQGPKGRQFPDGHLPDASALPALALGGQAADPGHVAAGLGRVGSPGGRHSEVPKMALSLCTYI